MNPSTQVLGREDQIDIRCPVPLQTVGIAQRNVLSIGLEYIFCQNIVLAISTIFNNKFKQISASFLRILLLLNALDRLKFVFSVKKKKGDVKRRLKKENAK